MTTNAHLAILRENAALSESLLGDNDYSKALRAAIATIEALPVTADGVRVVPGMTVHFREPEHDALVPEWTMCVVTWYPPDLAWCDAGWDRWFADRKNAEAARDGQGG